MQAQIAGDYSAALRCYAESLKLEEDPHLGCRKVSGRSGHLRPRALMVPGVMAHDH